MCDKKVYSIHFPENQVYINSTCYPLEEHLEKLKKNKDHKLYGILQDYPNVEIREEGDINSVSVKEVERRYYNDMYRIITSHYYPFSYKKNGGGYGN